MLLEIDNFEQFKVFFDVVYDITDLVELQLFRDHMTCSILDKAHTRFMTVEYKKEFFSVYEVDDVESVTLFVEDLHKIIKSASKIDNVILETNENYLICKFESKNGNSRVFEFVLPAEYVESPQPPSIPLPVSFKLQLNDLKQGLKDLDIIVSNEIVFTSNDGLLSLTSGTEVSANYSSNINVNTGDTGSLSAKFSKEYIDQLLKFDKVNKTVEFKMGDDLPLLYTFEDDIMCVKVDGLIAPRLEVD